MKKTLTVNLGGTVYNIDEDAYQLLDQYLSNLRSHFMKEDGSEEIMADFELRISELFSEKIRLGYAVVDINIVENIITRMGKPEEIFGEESDEVTDKDRETETTFRAQPETPTKKKLYRNPDDKIIGGIAGGLAAYMGWDATALRIGLLILLFFTQIVLIPVYVVLWIVVPLAQTATERLEMRGESVTLENIGKTVTSGFEKVSEGVNDYVNSGKTRSMIQKFGDLFVQIIGLVLKIAFFCLAIILAPGLLLIFFVFLVVTFAMLFGGASLLNNLMPWDYSDSYWMFTSDAPLLILFSGIGCFLLLAVPVGTALYAIVYHIFDLTPLNKTAKWTLSILWLIGLVLTIACGTMAWTSYINGYAI
jgi:phage shock protein PspC (stress-responsive transcriptional regulator)